MKLYISGGSVRSPKKNKSKVTWLSLLRHGKQELDMTSMLSAATEYTKRYVMKATSIGNIIAATVTASKDDAPAAVQTFIPNVAVLGSSSLGGGLIQATSG